MILTYDSPLFPLTIASVIILTGRILHWSLCWWWPLVWVGETLYGSSWRKKSLKQKVALNSNAEKEMGSAIGEGGTGKLGSKSGILPKQFALVPQILEISDLIS